MSRIEKVILARWVRERTGTVAMEYNDYRKAVAALCDAVEEAEDSPEPAPAKINPPACRPQT